MGAVCATVWSSIMPKKSKKQKAPEPQTKATTVKTSDKPSAGTAPMMERQTVAQMSKKPKTPEPQTKLPKLKTSDKPQASTTPHGTKKL
jgi:hypothetical protein